MSQEELYQNSPAEVPHRTINLRTALMMVLIVSGLTFTSQVIVSLVTFYQYSSRQTVLEAELKLTQTKLELRLNNLLLNRDEQVKVLEKKISQMEVTVGNEDSFSRSGLPTDSPFIVDDAMLPVVEIICLDNTDKDIYYTGSGTVIDESGLVLTNRHLFVSADDSIIRFCGVGFTDNLSEPPVIEYIAEATASQSELDLMVLQIVEHIEEKAMPDTFPAINLFGAAIASRDLRLGDSIYIAGYPALGADTFTFTQGVVSGRVGNNLIKTSALIDSGTSGGAAFNGDGVFIGLPTAAARGEIGGSLGYLIGADIIEVFLQDFYAGNLNDSIKFSE